ncbi:translation initiation factor IF-3 [bacterium]|nr:translation initiation factor IF-3 [bacterium]
MKEIRIKRYNVNHWIKATELRVITEDGTQVGIISKQEAMDLADKAGLDLVEISPNAKPPVAKITDFGKFKYEQDKQERKHRKSQKMGDLKEMRFGLKISDHDLDFKAKRVEKFLKDKNKVNIMLRFKGREITHKELGIKVLERVVERLSEVGKPDGEIKAQGMSINITLSPK